METKILLNFHGKIKKKFREIYLFDFTIFFAWTFLNFLAHCDSCCLEPNRNRNDVTAIYVNIEIVVIIT